MIRQYFIFLLLTYCTVLNCFASTQASATNELKDTSSEHARRSQEEDLTDRISTKNSTSRDVGGKGHSGKGHSGKGHSGKGSVHGKGNVRLTTHRLKPGNQQSNDPKEDSKSMDIYSGLRNNDRVLGTKTVSQPYITESRYSNKRGGPRQNNVKQYLSHHSSDGVFARESDIILSDIYEVDSPYVKEGQGKFPRISRRRSIS